MTNLFFIGPDGCGKTTLSRRVAADLNVPRFKVETEKRNWKNSTFVYSLKFDALLPQFCRQTETSFVSDRGYACEWVYSQVFGRETDQGLIREIDAEWAEMGATHVICLRRDYSKVTDDLVATDLLPQVHEKYLEFVEWTKTKTIGIYVDEFTREHQWGNHDSCVDVVPDIDKTVKEIYAGLEAYKVRDLYPRVYEIIRKGELK